MKILNGFAVVIIFMSLLSLWLPWVQEDQPLITDSDIQRIERKICHDQFIADAEASMVFEAQLAVEGRSMLQVEREIFERTGWHVLSFDLAACLEDIDDGE